MKIRNAIETAGREVARDLEAGRYVQACRGFTTKAQIRMARLAKGGCAELLELSRGIATVATKTGTSYGTQVGLLFELKVAQALAHAEFAKHVVTNHRRVIARLEAGHWRFEGSEPGGLSPIIGPHPHLPAGRSHPIEALARSLSESGSGSANTRHK
jgi:hypothetical protein